MTNFYEVQNEYAKQARYMRCSCLDCKHCEEHRLPFETALLKAERIVDSYFEPREGHNRAEVLRALAVELGRASASQYCKLQEYFIADPEKDVKDCCEYRERA